MRHAKPSRAALLSFLDLLPAGGEAGVNAVTLSPLDLVGARVEGLRRVPFSEGLLEGAGTLESPVLEAARPFDDLVGSWNADVPPGGWLEMQVSVRVDGTWTKWYRLGRWQDGGPRSLGRQEDLWGHMDVDTLRLRGKADAYRYRVQTGASGRGKVRLRAVSIAYENDSDPPRVSEAFSPGPWVRELPVPARSQMEEQSKYKSDICSPTSLAMVLEFWGKKKATMDVARLVQDREEGIYGNWPLNVAGAASLGLSGSVARLRGLQDLQREIAAGRPTVVSISFKEGELPGAPIVKTRGHLLVVVGFTSRGNVIVNDPAAAERGSVRRTYPRAEFERAWLTNKRGLAYLLGGRFPAELAAGVPTADLRRAPRAAARANPMDEARVSQLLYGEPVCALEARGDWVRVIALEQPDRACPGDVEAGYEGWVRADELRSPPFPYRPDAVVRAKRADLLWRDAAGREQSLTLPIGSWLASAGGRPSGPAEHVDLARLLDGRLVRTSPGTLRALPKEGSPIDRREILEAAALFLGDRYVWGGRSSQQRRAGWGVDCSGLVQVAYRAVGAIVPRDAHAQFLRARPVKRRQLQPGDPVFLTDPQKPERVNHVMLYAGGEGLLESRESAGKTVRTTFEERFGRALSDLESGDSVLDSARAKPARRRIRFGSFLQP